MQLEIKFKSIAFKWFFNIFLVVAITICAAAIAFSVVYTSIQAERIEVLATDYTYEFSALSSTDKNTFTDTAISIAGSFKYKNNLEVQVFDSNGNLVVSTTGFNSTSDSMPDYQKSKEYKQTYTTKTKTFDGERIMASTTPIYDSKGKMLGAYRWITSMEEANSNTFWFSVVMAIASLGILGFFGF